jgi:uncharacterized RDD family membrane protein YckC
MVLEREGSPEVVEHAVKCPECGSETPAGLSQCRRCGHRLPSARGAVSPLFPETQDSSADFEPDTTRAPASSDLDVSLHSGLPERSLDRAEEALDGESLVGNVPLNRSPRASSAPADNPEVWREEISERVEKFRRHRAHLRDLDANGSLELDFQPAAGRENAGRDSNFVVDFPAASDDPETAEEPEVQDAGAASLGILGSATGRAESRDQEWPLSRLAPPMDRSFGVVLGDQPWGAETAAALEPVFRPAPLGRRCLAGLIDALVLLLGTGVFTLIFWAVGGHISRNPVTLAVMGFIGVLFVLVYFASFIALTSSTPGLLAMNLEVQTLDGQSPTPGDAALRAFGYLVSAGALMLGFIWAWVDSDGLTWHDRMSGTFVSEREPAAEA